MAAALTLGTWAPIALSTMWFQRFPDPTNLRAFFESGKAAGFDRFELSHILGAEAVRSAAGERVVSVHHPCPRPANDIVPAFTTGPGREAARSLRRTVETAASLGASHVVLHLGPAPDADGRMAALAFEARSRYLAGDPQWSVAARRLADALATVEPAALARAADALGHVADDARAAGIQLGWETGERPLDLPTLAGAEALLATLPDVGAWMDTGHIACRGRLGFGDLDTWISTVGSRWIGAHLHDAVGLRDHLIPGSGDVDFSAACRALSPAAIRTCEVDWYFDEREIAAGAQHVLEAGCGA